MSVTLGRLLKDTAREDARPPMMPGGPCSPGGRASSRAALHGALLFACLWTGVLVAAPADTGAPPVVIDFFFETGCPECQRIKEEVLPQLESRCEGFYVLVWNDLGNTTNMVKLMAYQAALGTTNRSESVAMVVDYTRSFNGLDEIRKGLIPEVERCVEARLRPGWKPPVPIVVGTGPKPVAPTRHSRNQKQKPNLELRNSGQEVPHPFLIS